MAAHDGGRTKQVLLYISFDVIVTRVYIFDTLCCFIAKHTAVNFGEETDYDAISNYEIDIDDAIDNGCTREAVELTTCQKNVSRGETDNGAENLGQLTAILARCKIHSECGN